MLKRAADTHTLLLHSGPIVESCHIQSTFQLLQEPTRGVSADADTLSQIITLIKILRIKRSLIKDPVKLWKRQFPGLALLFCGWWVAKQNQKSLNYKDERQNRKGMRESDFCDGDGPAPVPANSALFCVERATTHHSWTPSTFLTIRRTELVAMPIYLRLVLILNSLMIQCCMWTFRKYLGWY